MLPIVLFRNETGASSVCMFGEERMRVGATVLRALVSIQFLVAVTIVLVNAYTMAAIWPRRHRRSTQSTLFVLHLALADMLCGLSKTILAVFSMDCKLAELASTCEVVCLMPVIITVFTWTLSATTLAAIAVDRYVCIVHSLRYYEFMNTRRVLLILAGLWVFSGLCAGLYLPTWSWQEGRYCEEQSIIPMWHLLAVQIPLSALVLFVVAATHISIRGEVKRNVARCSPSWVDSTSSSASVRSAKITILVVLSFVMGYVPMEVLQVLMFVDRESVSLWDFYAVEIFSSLWYLLNPFIYAWKNASIREDMRVLWRRIWFKNGAVAPRPPQGARRF